MSTERTPRDPNSCDLVYQTFLERFWSKVERTDWCWLWSGGLDSDGYGRIKVEGFTLHAHRVAFELLNGPRPSVVQVLHRCDNRRCVRPDHLFEGDHVANMKDAVAKGRMKGRRGLGLALPVGPMGGASPRRLTDDQVREIRARHAEGKSLQREIAAEFGITPSHLSGVLSGRYHKSIPAIDPRNP